MRPVPAQPRFLPWLLFLLLVLRGAACAQEHLRTTTLGPHRITYWTTEQGLPQNTVTCLLQSQNGYLWIGTRYGLARYDGLRFQDLTSQLCQFGTEELHIRRLAEDDRGRVWLLTPRSLIAYQHGEFTRHSLSGVPLAGEFQEIAAHPRGGLWLVYSDGIARFADGQITGCLRLGFELVKHWPSPAKVLRLVQPSSGEAWVQTERDSGETAWQRLDPESGRGHSLTQVPDHETLHIGGLWQEPDGSLWMARPGELLHWEQGRLERYDATRAWGKALVKQVLRDLQGSVWVVAEGPVQLHRFSNGEFTSYGSAEGIRSPDDVRLIRNDREGSLWVGTGRGGLCRIQRRQLVSVLTGSPVGTEEVFSVHPGAEGRVWMATTLGVIRYQAGRFNLVPDSQVTGPIVKRVRTVFEARSGEVYSVLDFDGLQILRGDAFQPLELLEPLYAERRLITGLAEDSRGTLWIASKSGLGERRGTSFRLWTTLNGLSDNRTFGLLCGNDGSVWVGTEQGGVNEFKEGRFRAYTTREGLLSQNAWPLRMEPDGTVWVGTPVGLSRIRDGQVRRVTMRDGLFDNLAYCLLEDRRGNYWTFGNRGIWRCKKEELHAVADGKAERVHCLNYGEGDGMPSSEGNGDQQPNAAELPNGEFWFPTTRGVVILHPDRVWENTVPPTVIIEEVFIDNERVFHDGGFTLPPGFSRTADGTLRVPPGRARVVEVSYTATTLVESEKSRFRCRLLGNAGSWDEMDTRRIAVFTNLRPGQYRFEVEGRNHHGYWSRSPAAFGFSLQPHFYETWPFYGFCTAGVAVSFGLWRQRRREVQQQLQRLERDRAVETERNRIASNLHDDLGANLTGLAVQLDLAVHQMPEQSPVRDYLQTLSSSARRLVDSMREAVWSINPQCDTLENFCAYICQYAEKFLQSVEIRCRFDLPTTLPPLTLSSELRHHLLLVVKEALNNAARHAAASEVRLSLRLEAEVLVLAISDNGRGCLLAELPGGNSGRAAEGAGSRPVQDPAFETGHGIRNMRHRVELLGGRFTFTSNIGSGTTVRVRVPIPVHSQQ